MTVVTERGRLLVEFGQWRAHELVLTLDKTDRLWQQMSTYRTLFNDFTRGDVENFYNLISLHDSYWLEVVGQDDNMVGVIYWTNMAHMIDCDVHIMFFDRRPAEKTEFCIEVAKWFFRNNPGCNRMTATLPILYHATIRLARRIGFRIEGKKLESQLMDNKLVDELILGMLAREIL